MRCRSRISQLVVLLLLLGSCSIWASDKKGVGLADLHAPERIAALNVAWYYTWQLNPVEGVPSEKFVPMIWGGNQLGKQLASLRAKGKAPVLLAINEPDVRDQANMSVEDVTHIWPEISSLAEKVSSPTPADVSGPWFEKFSRMRKARGLKFDFMAIHLYGPPDPGNFLKKVDATYAKYHMPIWITEFAVADWGAAEWNCKGLCKNRYSEEEVLTFMKAILPELEKRQYVVRYAWFGAGKSPLIHEQVRTSRLFEKDGSLTALGRYYAEFE